MKTKIHFYITLICCFAFSLSAQTIAEKKAGLTRVGSVGGGSGDLDPEMQRQLVQTNRELVEYQEELANLYAQVERLHAKNARESEYQTLLDEINAVREQIDVLEENWRLSAIQGGKEEGYALWNEPETTLGQLILDFGSHHYVYLVPQEISDLRLNIDSNLPIPRASWDEMLELIIQQNGVAFRQLNPYLRELYFTRQDRSRLALITNRRSELNVLPPETRVCFVLEPEPADLRRIWLFLEKFSSPNTVSLQMIGRDILIVGQVSEVQDLLKIYDFASETRGDKEYRAVTLMRVDAEEMAKILGAIFDQLTEPVAAQEPSERGRKGRPKVDVKEPSESNVSGGSGLRVIALKNIAQAVFLVGTKEEIKKAEEIIRQVENQVGDAREKVIHWYTVKHADPEELAEVLDRMYFLMVSSGARLEEAPAYPPQPPQPINDLQPLIRIDPQAWQEPPVARGIFEDGYYLSDRFVVSDEPGGRKDKNHKFNQNRNNFIVDPKTGSIAMVVEADILPKLKELIRKLDVPIKMVQLECMLFEKRVRKENNIGLNLLRIGSYASQQNATAVLWDQVILDPLRRTITAIDRLGILQFFISRKANGAMPAYDLSYKFIISRDDVSINASPSVLTLNQVLATIKIEEEISVNTGTYVIQDAGQPTLKDAFARARYGIKIEITPTIHMADDMDLFDDSPDYVTLDTNILFETIVPGTNGANRPDVVRREIVNTVRIPDGQTVILGGLRRKNGQEAKETIPFIGDLPGIGKLFCNDSTTEESTEMFIFITPKIIRDPVEDLEKIRCEEMMRRPGDIPCFLCKLVEARRYEKERLFAGTISLLMGFPEDRCVCPTGEYDGR